MKTDKRKMGDLGEEIACKFLKKNGYIILQRNYVCKSGEIDIVALETKRARRKQSGFSAMPKVFRDEDVIVFVEVKTRSSDEFGRPSEAVGSDKQKRYELLGRNFLLSAGCEDAQFRFDIIEVEGGTVNHIPNAF